MSDLTAFEELVFKTSGRKEKMDILGIWISEMRKKKRSVERELHNLERVITLLEEARSAIDKEVYDAVFAEPTAKVDWQKFLEVVKDSLCE